MYGNSRNGSHSYSNMDLDQVVINSCRFMMDCGLCFSMFLHNIWAWMLFVFSCKNWLYLCISIVLLLCVKHKKNFGLETFQLLETFINNGLLSCVSFYGISVLCFKALEIFLIPSSPLYTSNFKSLTRFYQFFHSFSFYSHHHSSDL